jgi:Rod binding domain-containing protein
MPFPAMPSQITCPKCKTPFVVEVRTIIDLGQEPELKEELLRGQINLAECPNCGGLGMLSTPLLYHDPGKELLISYVPPELNLNADQQERFIGSLVNLVLNALPAEKRKGYFLQPKTAFTLDSLYDLILEADGISKDLLEQQRSQLKLIDTLMAVVDDDKTLDRLVEEHRAELTYGFFLLLSDLIDAQPEQELDEPQPDHYTKLREKLLARVSPQMPSVASQATSADQLIALLQEKLTSPDWRATLAVNRARLDYGFFQVLTAKIEAAEADGDQAKAQELTDLRKSILDELDQQDRLLRDAEDKASLLIMQLSEAQDLPEALRAHRQEINEVFLAMLIRLRGAAEAQGDQARAHKLGAMLEAVLEVVEEKLPPDVRLINKLLRVEHPDGSSALLEEYRGLLSDTFLAKYDEYIASLGKGRDKDLAEHLKKIRPQIVAKMTIARA